MRSVRCVCVCSLVCSSVLRFRTTNICRLWPLISNAEWKIQTFQAVKVTFKVTRGHCYWYYATERIWLFIINLFMKFAVSALTLLIGRQEGHPTCKNWVVECWRGSLSGVRCRLAYGAADATATHCLLLQWNPHWFFTFLVPVQPGSPGKMAVKRACVSNLKCISQMVAFVHSI